MTWLLIGFAVVGIISFAVFLQARWEMRRIRRQQRERYEREVRAMSGAWPFIRAVLSHPVTWLVTLLVVILVAVGLTVGFDDSRPTPNELCRRHNGVRNVGGGGWATPLYATCRDGYAGEVEP
jgi:hypothetical protein